MNTMAKEIGWFVIDNTIYKYFKVHYKLIEGKHQKRWKLSYQLFTYTYACFPTFLSVVVVVAIIRTNSIKPNIAFKASGKSPDAILGAT